MLNNISSFFNKLAKLTQTQGGVVVLVYLLLLFAVFFKFSPAAFLLTLIFLGVVFITKKARTAFYLGIFSLSFDQFFISIGFSLKIHMLVFLVVALVLIFKTFQERKLPVFPSQSINASLFFLMTFSSISVYFAEDKILALRFLASLFYAISVLYLTFFHIRQRSEVVTTTIVLTAGMVVSVIVALQQYVGYYFDNIYYGAVGILEPGNFARPIGIFNHPNFLANFLLISIPIALTYALTLKKGFILKYIIIPAALVALIVTFSRAAYIGITSIFGLILFFTKEVKELLSFTRDSIVSGSLVVIMIVALFYLVGPLQTEESGGKKLVKRVTSSVEPEAKTNIERLQIWQAGFKMLNDNWLTGVGLENFRVRYDEYKLPEAVRENVVAHNTYLQLIAEIGVFGAIAFAVFWLTIFWRNLQALLKLQTASFYHYILLGSMAALLGVTFQNLTNSVLYYPHTWFLYGFILAISNLALTKR